MSNVKFSVIVPVYNAERSVGRCLASVRAQTEGDFECLIVDDGSTDSSGKICDDACRADGRFRVFHVPNGGVGRARNIGLDEASGDWIAFCDSDDWYDAGRLETVWRAAKRSGCPAVWSPMRIWQRGRPVGCWHGGIEGVYETHDGKALSSKKYDIGHAGSKAYLRSALEGVRFPEGVPMSEDLLFNIDAYFQVGSMYNDGVPTYNYDRRETSASAAERTKEGFV